MNGHGVLVGEKELSGIKQYFQKHPAIVFLHSVFGCDFAHLVITAHSLKYDTTP